MSAQQENEMSFWVAPSVSVPGGSASASRHRSAFSVTTPQVSTASIASLGSGFVDIAQDGSVQQAITTLNIGTALFGASVTDTTATITVDDVVPTSVAVRDENGAVVNAACTTLNVTGPNITATDSGGGSVELADSTSVPAASSLSTILTEGNDANTLPLTNISRITFDPTSHGIGIGIVGEDLFDPLASTAVAIGSGTGELLADDVVIGFNGTSTRTTKTAVTVIGNNTTIQDATCVCVGHGTVAWGDGMIAIGNESVDRSRPGPGFGSSKIAIGSADDTFPAATASFIGVAIGTGATTTGGTRTFQIGTDASSAGQSSLAIGYGAMTAYANRAVAIGSNVGARTTREIAFPGMRALMVRNTSVTVYPAMLLSAPLNDGETVFVDAFVSMYWTSGTETQKSRVFRFRRYLVARTGSTVEVVAGNAAVIENNGGSIATPADQVTIVANGTDAVGVQANSVTDASTRVWTVSLYLYSGDVF